MTDDPGATFEGGPIHGGPQIGLVLSGGGARGAYEVGVLRYLRDALGFDTNFDVITGTSVGAINGSYLAATCERPRAQVRMLQRVWLELGVDQVYQFGWRQLRELPRVLFGRDLPKVPHGAHVGGLIDTSFLEELVRSRVPWRGISENLRKGNLQAYACTATEVATGISTVFVQTSRGRPRWAVDDYETVVHTPITAAHTLASAAIPLLFPAVRVGDQFFVDGSLRQNTPMRPAMRLGANRLLLIGLRQKEPPAEMRRRQREEAQFLYPNALFLAGKMLNALMVDAIEADMQRIERVNSMLEAGTRAFGSDFGQRWGESMGRTRPYTPIQTVLIRPSQDLGKIATEVVRRNNLAQYDGLMARWIRRAVAAEEQSGESDLASYVLFDPAYVKELIDLGYEDARAQRAELQSLFDR